MQDFIMADWLTTADDQRAKAAWTWLTGFLASSSFPGASDLLRILGTNEASFRSQLAQHPPLCKGIEHLQGKIAEVEAHGFSRADARVMQNIGAMLYTLVAGFHKCNGNVDIQRALETSHDLVFEHYLTLARDQVDSVCRYVVKISNFFATLSIRDSRIVLIEMPVGNSLLVKCLEALFKEKYQASTIRVALSRNDSKKVGITRRELLAEKLGKAGLATNDIVVYVDEWNTGSNFTAICEAIRKCLPTDCFFFPAAVLSGAAHAHDRYQSFCANHDLLLRRWGLPSGAEFRCVLPAIPSDLLGDHFFWSEHDRTAGYRKMQLHGSMFSSIDDAIETLHKDAQMLRAAAAIYVGSLGRDLKLPGSPEKGVAAFVTLFGSAYDDYKSCRNELRACAEEFAHGGEIDDFGVAMAPLLEKYQAILNKRDAMLAVALGCEYIRRLASLDPADRYSFREHAPVLVELAGPMARTHDIVMSVLRQRIESIARESHG